MNNFDLLVSGCNTRCKHCYVNGGPGPMMDGADALRCIAQLDAIASLLSEETSFTLDHEPMNHPEIGRIMRAASKTAHIAYFHHGMTTGLGLMRREDRDAVLDAYLACGFDSFGLTIHGNAALHDEITRRKGAYETMLSAGAFLKAHGAKLSVSLMLNRYSSEQAEEIQRALDRLKPDEIYAAFPIYTPHENGMDYEPYRASTAIAEALRLQLIEWRQDADELIGGALRCCAASAVRELENGMNISDLFHAPQDERYLCVHPDCRLYMGNSGAETECLGDLRTADPAAIAEAIRTAPYNRDYGAFYDRKDLPPTDRLIAALKRLPQQTVYGDFPSVIYRGLFACGTPTKILRSILK